MSNNNRDIIQHYPQHDPLLTETTTPTTPAPNTPMSCGAGGGEGAAAAGVHLTFPYRLHTMLTDVHDFGLTEVVSFQGNKHFKVHNRGLFEAMILPRYFQTQTYYKSFQRQLAMYGFTRERRGPHKGAYTHQHLLRGSRDKCSQIIRHKPVNSCRALTSPASFSSSTKGTKMASSSSSSSSTPFLMMPCLADILDAHLSIRMEKVALPLDLPSPFDGGDEEETPNQSCTGYNKFSTRMNSNCSEDTADSFPMQLLDYNSPSLIDLIHDACDFDSVCFEEMEPFDTNGQHHGFTADIADEVVRTFGYL